MNPENLVRMANRIAEFFDAMPDHEEAVQGIANHIQRFWEPRMRRGLAAHLAAHQDGAGLLPSVLEALQRVEAARRT